MPYATNPIDTNRGTTGIQLTPQQSAEIWQNAIESSAVMQLAQQVQLPGSGITIPVITGDASADWVAETAEKPVSGSTFGMKQMTPYKLAVIELFSNEFKRDLPALYSALVERLPQSIGKKFDETVFTGTAPGSNFDVLSGANAISLGATAGVSFYQKLVGAYEVIGAADGELSGWALSPTGKAMVMKAEDGNGYPLFMPDNHGTNVGSILGAPVSVSKKAYEAGTPNTIGFAGDWTQARYGIVDGINLAISEEATINDGTEQINLWQRNMFAVRVEAEVGFIVKDINQFVKLTD
jgi:HK97 family phage major capsid protein